MIDEIGYMDIAGLHGPLSEIAYDAFYAGYSAGRASLEAEVAELIDAAELALEAFAVYDRKGWLEPSPRKDLSDALKKLRST